MANPYLTVLVLNLSPSVTLGELTSFFSYCGHVEKIQLLGGNKDRSQSALVSFRQPYAYQTALLLNDAIFAGQPIRVLPKKNFADPLLSYQMPNVIEKNKKIQGNIPVVCIEKLNETRDEVEKRYKLTEKSKVLMKKTRSAIYAAEQTVSAAEEAARDLATRIINTDYVAMGATWFSGVLDKTSKLVVELGTGKGFSPNSRNHM